MKKILFCIFITLVSCICMATPISNKDFVVNTVSITNTENNTVQVTDRRRVWKFLKKKQQEEERQREEENNQPVDDDDYNNNPGLDNNNQN